MTSQMTPTIGCLEDRVTAAYLAAFIIGGIAILSALLLVDFGHPGGNGHGDVPTNAQSVAPTE